MVSKTLKNMGIIIAAVFLFLVLCWLTLQYGIPGFIVGLLLNIIVFPLIQEELSTFVNRLKNAIWWKLREKKQLLREIRKRNLEFFEQICRERLTKYRYMERSYDEDIFRHINNKSKANLLVYGKSGYGKTLLLLNLFKKLISVSQSTKRILPVYWDLHEKYTTFVESLENISEQSAYQFISNVLKRLTKELKLIFLIDDLTVNTFNSFKVFMNAVEQLDNIVVVTAVEAIEYQHIMDEKKYSQILFKSFDKIEIKGLNNSEIKEFIERRDIKVTNKVPENLPEFLRNPRFLDLYISIIQEEYRQSTFSEELWFYYKYLASFCHELYEKTLKLTDRRIREILYLMYDQKRCSLLKTTVLRHLREEDIRELIRYDIFRETTLDRRNYFGFTHLTLCVALLAIEFYDEIPGNEKIMDILDLKELLHEKILRFLLMLCKFNHDESKLHEIISTLKDNAKKTSTSDRLMRMLIDAYNEMFEENFSFTSFDIKVLKDVLKSETGFNYFVDLIMRGKLSIKENVLLQLLKDSMNNYERKRRVCEALPFLFKIDQSTSLELMKELREDFHKRFKSDIRRRVVEAVGLTLERYKNVNKSLFLGLLKIYLNGKGFDEPFTLMALIEVIVEFYPKLWTTFRNELYTYIEKFEKLKDRYSSDKRIYRDIFAADVKEDFEFLEELLRNLMTNQHSAILLMRRHIKNKNVLIRISIARNLWRISNDKLFIEFYEEILKDKEKNVRRPLGKEKNIAKLISIYENNAELRINIHNIIRRLANDQDELIRITILDDVDLLSRLNKEFLWKLINERINKERNKKIVSRLTHLKNLFQIF